MNLPSVAAWAIRACVATTSGWRGFMVTTDVPTDSPGTANPSRGASDNASVVGNWANQSPVIPADRARRARSTRSRTELSVLGEG